MKFQDNVLCAVSTPIRSYLKECMLELDQFCSPDVESDNMIPLNLSDVSKKLTEEVIQRAFRIKTDSVDNIKCIKVMPAAPAGEGLIGAVYRVTVEGQYHNASFIAKGLVNDQLLRKSIVCAKNFFKREAFFYSTILPVLIALQKSLGAKESLQSNVPVSYGSYIDGENDYILLEDLAEKGCKSLPAKPTEYERDITLKALAHFHAVSIALRVKKPELFNTIANKMPELYYNDENRDWYAAFLQKAIDIDVKTLSEFENPSTSAYFQKFKELISYGVYDQLIKLSSHRDDHAVFNHGDAWIPNFLCSEDRTVAIDFQGMRCASVALDLSYFLTLCCNLIQTPEDFMNAVKIYYNFLKYYLRDMGIDEVAVLSWDTLIKELNKYGKFGLLAAITSIPLLVSDKCDNLEKFEDKYAGYDKIPLEELWKLTPFKSNEQKKLLVNAVRIAVDIDLI